MIIYDHPSVNSSFGAEEMSSVIKLFSLAKFNFTMTAPLCEEATCTENPLH